MISKRIVLLVAPWCFVLLVAIGCSKQGGRAERSPAEQRSPITAMTKPEASAGRVERKSPLERYAELVQSEPDPIKLRQVLASFYTEWGHVDGGSAVDHAFAQNRSLMVEAFAGWLEVDAQAPRDWVLASDSSARKQSQLGGGLLRALPTTDHAQRSQWAAHFAQSESGAPIVSGVAIAWGESEPQQALEWLDQLPEGDPRTGAIETIFNRWVKSDPELASTHLTRMPDGDAKDLAISSLAKTIHRDDPEAARLWADTISDASLRELTNFHLSKLAATAVPPIPGS